MTKPKPKVITPLCIPECAEYPHVIPDLSDELAERALRAHDQSYRGGSFSPFYDSCTKDFIRLVAEPLAKEAVALHDLHGRPLDKVLRAAVKALAALQTAITEFNQEEVK